MIRVERRELGIAWVTVDRPAARNAMTFAMWARLRDVAVELDADPSVRVVVFTGEGGEAFVAGTDIAEFRAFTGEGRRDRLRAADRGGDRRARRDPRPDDRRVAGACTGGGVSIAATCDLRIAAPNARIGIPIARTLGNIVSLRNVARVGELIGLDAAKALLITGTLLGARDALRAGFLTEVVDDGPALHPRAGALAESIAGLAPLTVRASKEIVRRIRAARALPDADDLIRACYGSSDFREGLTAFLDKRRPDWTGS